MGRSPQEETREEFLARIDELTRAREGDRHLEARHRLDALARMAGGVAHDFNNLLTGIMGSVDLAMLEVGGASGVHLREHLVYIQEVSEQARRLCLQLLAYSGSAPFDTAPGDVSAVLSGARVAIDRAARGQRVSLQLAADLPPVELNAGQLQQAVLGLVRNASDALGHGAGVITIRTALAPEPPAGAHPPSYEPLPPGRYVVVEVSDGGCGMDEATRARLFDPFFSTKVIARGLGMAVVLGAVRAHRGAVDVRTRPGEGTTVRLLLPALERAAPAQVAAAPEDTGWMGHGTLLVVDDDPLAAGICGRMLRRLGFSVVVAGSGAEALALFEARGGDVRGAVVDVTMPEMDGMELLRRLRSGRPDLPGLLATGYSAGDATAGAQADGVTAVLQKPYDLRTLRERLRALLDPA